MDRVDTTLFDRPLRATLTEHRHLLSGLVLDVGCGSQPYRDLATPDTRWIGVDFAVAWSGRTEVQLVGSAEALPVRSGTADAVISTQVIEHLPHPWLFFSEAARILRPGGHLVVSAPHAQWLHEEPHDYYRFTKYGMAQLARDAGLEVEDVIPLGGAVALVGFLTATHIPTRGVSPRHLWMRTRKLLQRMINAMAGFLDARFYSQSDTTGNVLIARRPE